MVERLQSLVDFMLAAAADGDPKFLADVASGHRDLYLSDMRYIEANAHRIRRGIVSQPPRHETPDRYD
jgi:hypothetical protein